MDTKTDTIIHPSVPTSQVAHQPLLPPPPPPPTMMMYHQPQPPPSRYPVNYGPPPPMQGYYDVYGGLHQPHPMYMAQVSSHF